MQHTQMEQQFKLKNKMNNPPMQSSVLQKSIQRVYYQQQQEFAMEQFMENVNSIRERIQHGTSMCPKKQYPFMLFKCGLMFAKIPDINKTYNIIQTVQYLRAQNRLNQTVQCHLLCLLYEHPHLYQKIYQILDKILQNKPLNMLLQLQSLQPAHQERKSQAPNRQIRPPVDPPSPVVQPPLSSSSTQKYQASYLQSIIQQNKQSQALAKQLQQEQQQYMRQLREKAIQEDLCEICYVGLYDEEFLPLQTCQHIFHKNCLSEYYKNQISQNRFPLKCPNDKCACEVKDIDIKHILAGDLYQKYQKHTLKHYADMHGDSISWCPTANCQYMFFFEKDDNPRFQCLQCKKQYCLNCRVEWHKDMTCKQYQISNTHNADDDAFMKFVKGKKFKQCPKCKFWVQKNQGCDHMTCKCKFQFCYKCGGIYMKCECVQKMQQQIERRRQQAESRRRKKLQAMQRKKQKIQQASQPPARGRRRR